MSIAERIARIPISRMRNFFVIAHIDHGKSSWSRRQFLDKLDVERERGITVKAQTCSMLYEHEGVEYLLHLVDTPGHVDFRAEVSRSYASCNGGLLLVDASQGIQAQTVSNFHTAYSLGLVLIPVVNKIDLPAADPERTLDQIEDAFELPRESALLVSAKSGANVGAVLPAVIERIPPPTGSLEAPLKCLLVDSWYDTYLGVVLLVRVFDGILKAGDLVISAHTRLIYETSEVGIMHPDRTPMDALRAGQVGYAIIGMKNSREANIGDTFMHLNAPVAALPGFEKTNPMVFVGAFPVVPKNYEKLRNSISRLSLSDRSVTINTEFSTALGQGWRIGFLGTLHASVFQDRLRQEHGGDIIVTQPTVPYRVIYVDREEKIIYRPDEFPAGLELQKVKEVQEPLVKATITTPSEYIGSIIELCESSRGEQLDLKYVSSNQVVLQYCIPLAQLVEDLFSKVKSLSQGYASLDYEDYGYRAADLVKMQLLVNSQHIDALSAILHRSQVERKGREWVSRFRNFVERQLFEIAIQAAVGKKIIARETISAKKKDVTAKLYGGDVTRRMKLLEKQKHGKKKLRTFGNVVVSQDVFANFLANEERK